MHFTPSHHPQSPLGNVRCVLAIVGRDDDVAEVLRECE